MPRSKVDSLRISLSRSKGCIGVLTLRKPAAAQTAKLLDNYRDSTR
jgi:hypothetical protein